MADPGDIWQRYDAKVMQIQVMEARVAAIETELAQTRDERDHWARVCRDLGKKLWVARALAERLRSAERAKAGRPETTRFRRPAELSRCACCGVDIVITASNTNNYDILNKGLAGVADAEFINKAAKNFEYINLISIDFTLTYNIPMISENCICEVCEDCD